MCQTFFSMGAASAEHEIELAEQSPTTSIRSEIKPFTTKVDSHVIEALDVVAGSMGISRNTLVVKLINHYLPFAFDSFHGSRYEVFKTVCSNMTEKSSEEFVISALDQLLLNTEISEEAQNYLKRGIVDHVIGADHQ